MRFSPFASTHARHDVIPIFEPVEEQCPIEPKTGIRFDRIPGRPETGRCHLPHSFLQSRPSRIAGEGEQCGESVSIEGSLLQNSAHHLDADGVVVHFPGICVQDGYERDDNTSAPQYRTEATGLLASVGMPSENLKSSGACNCG